MSTGPGSAACEEVALTSPARTRRRVPPAVRVAGLLFAVSFGTNVPTPLLVLYRHRLGLSPTAVTSIFAVYAVGLLAALVGVAPASDRVGRRRVALPFAALAVTSSLLFLPAAHLAPLLFLARFAQGVVSGAVFSVGSAWLAEVSVGASAAQSARRSSMALNAGFAAGPLTAGVLGEWAPAPTVLPFLVHVALASLGLLLAWPVPETAAAADTRPVRLRLGPGVRKPFWALLAPTALMVFAFPATAATVLPFLLRPGTPAVAVTGLIAGLTLGTAALVAPAAALLGRAAAPVGLAHGAAGLGLAVVATHVHTWALLVPVSVLLGVACGLSMTAGLTLAERLSTEQTRGSVYALFYTLVYAGFGVPVVVTATAGAAVAAPFTVLAVVCVALAGWLLAAYRRHGPAVEPLPLPAVRGSLRPSASSAGDRDGLRARPRAPQR